MILYIPTREAEELLELISKYGDKFNMSWGYDMMEQIREQLPKNTKTVNLSDRIRQEVKCALKENGVKNTIKEYD